jgi:DUF3037 family protein
MSALVRLLVFPLRYYPNLSTGEFLNVGVGVVAPDVSRWGVRVAKRFRGFQRVFPSAQPIALRSTLIRIEREARRLKSRDVVPLFPPEEWVNLREPLERLVSGNRGALRWGEALVEATGEDLEAELDYWFEKLVQIKKADGSDPVAAEVSTDSVLEEEFSKRGILESLKPTEIGGYGGQRFEFTFRNGILNVFDLIDLDFKKSSTILNRGRFWRGSLDVVGEMETDMAFYGLIRFPRRKDLRADAEAAVSMIRHAHLGHVETYASDDISSLGMAAATIVS